MLEGRNTLSTYLLVLLGFIGILGPFGTDAFVPALPQISDEFDQAQGGVQIAFGFFGVGMATGQLVFGPLSDRYGRKIFLVVGLLMCAAGAVIAALAFSLFVLTIGCLLMGIGGSVSVVIVWAVVADFSHHAESARGLAIVDIVVSLGPILGPLGGALIMTFSSWRTIFLAIALYSVASCFIALVFVPESLERTGRTKQSLIRVVANYGTVFSNRNFLNRYISLVGCFAILFAYIGASPFLLMSFFHLNVAEYSLVFALNGAGIITAGFVAARLTKTVLLHKIMGVGVVLQLVSSVSLALLLVIGNAQLWQVIVLFFVMISPFGLIFGPGTALAIDEVREHSGVALGLLGASQFLFGGIALAAIGLGNYQHMLAFAVAAAAILSFLFFIRGNRSMTGVA